MFSAVKNIFCIFRNFATDVGSILCSHLSLIRESSPATLSVEVAFIHTVLAMHLIPQSRSPINIFNQICIMQCVAPEFFDDQAQSPYSKKQLFKDMAFVFLELRRG